MTLDGAKAKLIRAFDQMRLLQHEFERFVASPSHTVEQRFNPETGRKHATYRITRQFPETWPVVIGEILHDARSALDHAVYELSVLANNGVPIPGTEFPIFDDEKRYKTLSKNGTPARTSGIYKRRGVNDAAKAVIDELQPFEFRRQHPGDEFPMLLLIHLVNIVDKHRTLHLTRRSPQSLAWKVVREIQLPFEFAVIPDLEDGAELGVWTPTVIDDEPDVEFETTFEVAFGDTTGEISFLDGRPVIPLIEGLVKCASEVIVMLEKTIHPQSN